MKPFLERFYEEVNDNLADPHAGGRRLTKEQKYRDLLRVEAQIWERLLTASGQESSIGRVEKQYTFEADKRFYPLPGNFRQFISLERRQGGDVNLVDSTLNSIDMYDPGPGIEILSEQRGFIIRPMPESTASDDSNWYMTYIKGPVLIHYAKASGVTESTVKAGTPPADAGELIRVEEYYTGCILRIYSADKGAPQSREITGYNAGADLPTFTLRHPLIPVPEGDVYYEICPVLPHRYDSIYAMDVALINCGRRTNLRRRSGLKDDRKELWNACRNYFLSNVADRMPVRSQPVDPYEVDPYAMADW